MKKTVPVSVLTAFVALAVVMTFLLTFSLTLLGVSLSWLKVSPAPKDDDDIFDSVIAMYEKYYIGSGAVSGESSGPQGDMSLSERINSYIAALGDKYGYYYTREEYEQHLKDNSGSYCGIGVTVQQNPDITYTVSGKKYVGGINVIRVAEDSPVYGKISVGDVIIGVNGKYYSEIGYDGFAAEVKGDENTEVSITVLHRVVYERCDECDRLHYNTENAVENEYTVVRKELKQISVYGEMVSETTGYIKITGFEINTHEQFTRTLIDLIDKGAVDFIFDVRDNPGGRLDSVMKVLSTILDYDENAEKRALIRVLDKNGNSTGEYIKLSEEYMDYYDIEEDDTRPSFSYHKNAAEEYEKLANDMYKRAENEADELKKEEYLEKASEYERFAEFDYNLPKGAKVVVLTNGNTASAGELFTEVLRVYGVSLTVGTKTYGKGSMQSYLYVSGTNDMSMGVLKITANAYTSPYSESYNGIGIEPDVKISLEGDSALVSLWLLPKEDDAQYVYAYNILNPNGQMEMPDENDYKLYD